MYVALYRARRLAARMEPEPKPEPCITWKKLFSEDELQAIKETPLNDSKRSAKSLLQLQENDDVVSHFVKATTPRTGGRYEIKLSPSWFEALRANKATEKPAATLQKLIDALRDKPGCANARSVHTEWHLMRVAPGASAQGMHVDQNAKSCYWTLLVPLTKDPPDSGTVFKRGKTAVCINPYRGAVAFRGNVKHYGSAHPAHAGARLFLYAAITTGENWN